MSLTSTGLELPGTCSIHPGFDIAPEDFCKEVQSTFVWCLDSILSVGSGTCAACILFMLDYHYILGDWSGRVPGNVKFYLRCIPSPSFKAIPVSLLSSPFYSPRLYSNLFQAPVHKRTHLYEEKIRQQGSIIQQNRLPPFIASEPG